MIAKVASHSSKSSKNLGHINLIDRRLGCSQLVTRASINVLEHGHSASNTQISLSFPFQLIIAICCSDQNPESDSW